MSKAESPKAAKAPEAKQPETKQPKSTKPESKPEPKATKKSICIKMVSRKGGASLDEMAEAIAKEGIDSDREQNRKTAKRWVAKPGFPVSLNQKTGKYRKVQEGPGIGEPYIL